MLVLSNTRYFNLFNRTGIVTVMSGVKTDISRNLGIRKLATNSKGFTLVELITVVAIVSLLVVYITIKLGTSNEDSKIALATTFILGNVPTVIASYKARHQNSCTALPAAADGAVGLRTELINRGLVGTSPWNEAWNAQYNATDRELIIVLPLAGTEDPVSAATDIANNIFDAPQIDGYTVVAGATAVATAFTAAGTTPTIPDGVTRAGSVQVLYDCI